MKSASPSAVKGVSPLGRLLDIEQITRTLAFLSGYRPAVFEAAPDGVVCEAPRPRLDGRMAREDGGPEPYCTVCGEPTGIFLGHGPDWHHFRATAADSAVGPAEVYATDHVPAIGWRYIATACVGTARPGQTAT
jgi:hypothetical protein